MGNTRKINVKVLTESILMILHMCCILVEVKDNIDFEWRLLIIVFCTKLSKNGTKPQTNSTIGTELQILQDRYSLYSYII